jgi:nicotinate-nucleotide adenylyltransferase
MQVAFYGGSFNPPHVAHVLAAAYLVSVGGFERVLFVPVYSHAFDKQLAPFGHRVRMCELAVGWMPGVEVCRVEERLETPSLTLRTLRHLAAEHPDWRLRLVIGSDVLFESHKWHAFDEIAKLAPPYVIGRAGFPHPEAPPAVLPEVSSTRIRSLAARDDADAGRELEVYVPRKVLAYLREHALYR